MKNFILKNWSLFLVLSYVILVSAYALLNGTSSIWFQIHDNLDSNVVWYKMLRDNEGLFNPSTIIPFLGGSVYASGIVSPLKLINIPFLLFEPDVAMVVNYNNCHNWGSPTGKGDIIKRILEPLQASYNSCKFLFWNSTRFSSNPDLLSFSAFLILGAL